MSASLLDQALAYAEYGLAVFPLKPRDKTPITAHGVKDATRDPVQIRAWWELAPDANIGIATGQPSGVIVFDVDGEAGEESLGKLGIQLPMTPVASTGVGTHVYFRVPDKPVGNRAGMAPGLDLRGDGGYVVAPPSIHPSGRAYEWAVDLAVPFAAFPEWLLKLERESEPPIEVTTGPITQGKRNDTAFRDAASMRRRGMGEAAIFAALKADERYQPPLPDSELRMIAHDVTRDYAPDAEAAAQEEWQHRQKAKQAKVAAEEEIVEQAYVPGIEMSEVQPERTLWLWHPYFPAGKLVILDGDPGLGKSTLLLDLAARWSRGMPNPDGTVAERMPEDGFGIVVISVEDGLSDTVQPRLVAQRADLTKIRAIVQIIRKGVELSVTIPDDIPLIERAIQVKQARFMIIDPIMAVLSSTVDAHKDQDIRAKALQPLKDLAERTGCTIAMIRHLNKVSGSSAVYRGGGSIGIIGATRSAMLVGKDPADPDGHARIFAHTKSNLARSGKSWHYDIQDNEDGMGTFVWGEETDLTADDLVNQDLRDQPKKREAMKFLRDMLANGPMAKADLETAAKGDGISWRTVEDAATKMGVEKRKTHTVPATAVWAIKGMEDVDI